MRIFVTSLGIISPIGENASQTLAALETSACGLAPLSLFASSVDPPLPSGEIRSHLPGDVPRTHSLALIAAREAMAGIVAPPDAIVLGVTTGGMPASELLLKNNDPDKWLELKKNIKARLKTLKEKYPEKFREMLKKRKEWLNAAKAKTP